MSRQLSLGFEEREKATAAELAHKLVSFLESTERWCTRKNMRVVLGFTPRDCRKARQFSNGAVIYGQRGFKATKHATRDEIMECVNTLNSQAKVMQKESIELSRMWHNAQPKEVTQ